LRETILTDPDSLDGNQVFDFLKKGGTMKAKFILISVLLVFSLAASPSPDPFSPQVINDAIEVSSINERPIAVDPGESVIYHVRGTDIFVEVYNLSKTVNKVSLLNTLDSIVPLTEWNYTQVCGVNVTILGVKVAQLRNRVNVHYYQDTAKAPAKFNWYDMSGTQTYVVGFSWTLLTQNSNPSLGVRFNSSGWVVAQGTLNRCIAGICGPQGTYSSRLEVDTSGTRCR
jgi:hypothetical protein